MSTYSYKKYLLLTYQGKILPYKPKVIPYVQIIADEGENNFKEISCYRASKHSWRYTLLTTHKVVLCRLAHFQPGLSIKASLFIDWFKQ